MSYTSFQILGQGSFGVVYLSKNNKNELIAVKCKLQLNDYALMQKSNMLFRGELEAKLSEPIIQLITRQTVDAIEYMVSLHLSQKCLN
jgi:serine/threonine protein kinase